MTKLYAAVVLGAPTLEESYRRVDTAVELYVNGITDRIVVTGTYWPLHSRSHFEEQTVGQQMAVYAVSRGIPHKKITVADTSLNTIGDALVAKHALGLQSAEGRKVGIVTTKSHISRAATVFEHVFGPNFIIVPIDAGAFPKRRFQSLHEWVSNILTHAVLNGTKPGDDQTITKRLYALVPGYTRASNIAIVANHMRRIVGAPLVEFPFSQ